MTKKEMAEKIKELEWRIAALEARPSIVYPQIQLSPTTLPGTIPGWPWGAWCITNSGGEIK